MAPTLNWCRSRFSPNEWRRFCIQSGCPESPLPFRDCRRLRWGGERAGGGKKCCALSFILAAHKGSKIKTQAWGEKKILNLIGQETGFLGPLLSQLPEKDLGRGTSPPSG